jgi:DNA-binding CsgD family transcriptional regulator/tetratricopeptide (TPR) repeat protein
MLVPPLVCPELVGRRVELDALVERRRAAARGRGSFVLVRGDAGVGKTRLLSAFRETLSNGRGSVGAGTYAEFANLPYAGIAEALRGLGSAAPIATEATRPEQFAALERRFAAVAQRGNAVVILEDLHWADDASLAFLLQLARATPKLRLLVVATYRSDDLHRTHPAQPYVARLMREPATSTIALGPLDRGEMQRFVRAALAGRARPPRAVVDEIIERAEGNPFFAEELLKSAVESGDAHLGAALPLTIRAAVTERMTLLDAGDRAIIALAAVIGRRFEAEFLATISARPSAEILAALRGARDLQLLDELRSEPVSYAFRHALTREAIYDEMLAAEARPLHAKIVEAIERKADGAAAVDLGYHAWAARDAARTLRYNERAGDEAQALHAYTDALRAYERALEGAADPASRGRLFEKAGASCAFDGRVDRAVDLFEAAMNAYEAGGTLEPLPYLYFRAAGQAHSAGEIARARTILDRGLRFLPDDPASAARALLILTVIFLRNDGGEVIPLEELAQTAAAEHDPKSSAMFYNTHMFAAAMTGDVAMVRTYAQRLVAPRADGNVEGRVRAHYNVAFAYAVLGLDAEALAEYAALLPELGELRLAWFDAMASSIAALLQSRAGRFGEARTLVERALGVADRSTTARVNVAAAALTVGGVLCDDDLIARAWDDQLGEEVFAATIRSAIGRFAGPYARRLAAMGNGAGANAYLGRALEALMTPYGAAETLIAAAELGDAGVRRAVLGFADAMDAMPQVALYAAVSAHVRALVAQREGGAGFRDLARDAARRYAGLGWRYQAARAGELAGGAALLEEYRAMGAIADVRRLELGAAVANGARSARSTLSPREWEIARLVAAGTSNKALADHLAVSQKTIEKHLTSIYDKLGFRNRSELAAFVARKG